MASVPSGTKLGKYEVVKPLASGGMAELLLARTAPAARPLVLKWIRPEQAIDGAFIETFVSEARRAAQLTHPNIVQVHEVGREDGTHYMAMEYVHGDDLRKLLARLHERRAKLPVQHILAIATAVAQALHHAHEQTGPDGKAVLHLGIKPGNVIITSDGAVKIADFGIGRAALTEGRTDLLASIVGYLSPEQCTGQPVDRRSDVFGLGILMYELSVGRRLFKGDNDFTTMAAIVAGDIVLPTKHRGDLPKELEAVIMKALSRAPEDRYQTAQELHNALEKFATKAGVRGSLTTLAGYTKRLFGVRPEPWLVDDEHVDSGATNTAFDGAPKGLATPPPESLKGCSLPAFVTATDDSPIMRVKKQVSRDLPTEQLNLAALKAASSPVSVPDKSAPLVIPASNGNSSATRVAKPPRAPAPPPSTPPARNKPKTVQIPVQTADKMIDKAISDKEDDKERTTVLAGSPPKVVDVDTVTVTDAEDRTNVMPPSELEALKEDASERDRAKTSPVAPPAKPAKPLPKFATEDTVPAAKKSGINGVAKPAPALVSLAGLAEVDAKREAAKKPLLPPPTRADDPARLPKPSVAGEIKHRADTTDAEPIIDEPTEITATEPRMIETTDVANPPPMPPVVATTIARDITEHVKPLPLPGDKTVTATDSIVVEERGNKKWFFVIGGVAAAAIALAVYIGFGGDDDAKPLASETAPVAVDEPKPEPAPEAPKPEELRTADEPRTPRNSKVTTDDQPEEVKPEEPAVDEKVAMEPPEPPPPDPIPDVKPVEEKQPKVVEPPPPKFEEPKDPSPPDDEKPVVVKKPTTKPKPKQPKQPQQKVAAKPKPKPTAVAQKPKPTTKPKPKPATKPAGKWDPNALFPKK